MKSIDDWLYKSPIINKLLLILFLGLIFRIMDINDWLSRSSINKVLLLIFIVSIFGIVRWIIEEIEHRKLMPLDDEPKHKKVEPKKESKKPLNQVQKICILIFIACFWLWVGFGDGFRPQYSVIAFAIGITSIVAFFLFKDK